ncbi:MAG: hypothetical protein R3B47_02095 [Bacteroidia bacterium]
MKLRTILCLGLFMLFAFASQLQASQDGKSVLLPCQATTPFIIPTMRHFLILPSSQRVILPGMNGGLMLGYNAGSFAVRLNAIYGQQGNRIGLNSITNGLGGNAICSYRGSQFQCTHFTPPGWDTSSTFAFGFQTGGAEPPKVTFSFLVGGQASFLTKAKIYDNNDTPIMSVPSNVTSYPDAFEQFAPIVYSGVADFGFDFQLDEALEMNLHLRGEYGITDVENKDTSYRLTEGGITSERMFYPDGRATTNSISASLVVGLTYHLRSRWN